uniref:RNA-directed RNA polymerase n=1 Tax=Gongylonema pulchrum TaxID=637853 RepID=A0A183CX05_9BILA
LDSRRRLLSFGWIAWDVLAEIKKEGTVRESKFIVTADPLCGQISTRMRTFCDNNQEDFNRTITTLKEKLEVVKRYCQKYKGLAELVYVLCKWADLERLCEGRVRREHLCVLLLQFGIGHMKSENITSFAFLERVDRVNAHESVEMIDLNSNFGGIGKCFLAFLQYLSTRAFEAKKLFNFLVPDMGYPSVWKRGEWFELHRAAIKTFYRILFTSRMDMLPESGQISLCDSSAYLMTEAEPFVLEIPMDLSSSDEELGEKVQRCSNVRYLRLRRIPERKNRVVISAYGTLESLHRLRDILAVKPALSARGDTKSCNDMMLRQVYERIVALP